MKNLKMNKGQRRKIKMGMKYVLIVFCFALSYQSQCQIRTMDGKTFEYKNHLYDSKTIRDVLSTSEEASLLYEKFGREKRKANVYGCSALGSLGLSGILLYQSSQAKGFDGIGTGLVGIGFGYLGAIFGTIGIIKKGSSKKYMTKAVNHYNWEVGQGVNKEEIDLQLEVGTNSVGLRYSF